VSTTDVIGIVIAAVVVAAFAFVALRGMQHRRLRERFGEEYEQVARSKGRSAAESELRDRQRRHDRLDLHDLTDEQQGRYRKDWLVIQQHFVDDPVAAVRDSDLLVNALVSDRGYPASNYEDRLSHLSVEYANVLNHYRDAHEISVRSGSGAATTEQLRQAMVNYRELIGALLGEQPIRGSATENRASPETTAESRVHAPSTDAPANAASTGDGADAHRATPDVTDPADSVSAGTRSSASRSDASARVPDATRHGTPPNGR